MNNEMLSKIQKDLINTLHNNTYAYYNKFNSLEDKDNMTILVIAEKYVQNSKEIFQDIVEILVYKEINYVALYGIITLFQEDWDKLVVEANSSVQALVC